MKLRINEIRSLIRSVLDEGPVGVPAARRMDPDLKREIYASIRKIARMYALHGVGSYVLSQIADQEQTQASEIVKDVDEIISKAVENGLDAADQELSARLSNVSWND